MCLMRAWWLNRMFLGLRAGNAAFSNSWVLVLCQDSKVMCACWELEEMRHLYEVQVCSMPQLSSPSPH